MKEVKEIPPPEYQAQRDPWLDTLLNGTLKELSPADWKDRYGSPRSAASAIHQAARKRGFTAHVAIRGETLYVQAIDPPPADKAKQRRNGAKPAGRPKAGTTKTPAPRKAPAKRKAAAA